MSSSEISKAAENLAIGWDSPIDEASDESKRFVDRGLEYCLSEVTK